MILCQSSSDYGGRRATARFSDTFIQKSQIHVSLQQLKRSWLLLNDKLSAAVNSSKQ